MSGYKRVNFYELCRLCATNQQKEKTHIFTEEGRKIQLQNKIQSCLSLTVCETDFLPKVVCSKCLRTLEVCYTFRQECVTSESMLSSYFKNFRYTEDFKKSGKVYIKDTTTMKPLLEPVSSTTTLNNVTTTVVTNPSIISTGLDAKTQMSHTTQSNQMDHIPFYTLQLPTLVTNQTTVEKQMPKQELSPSKIVQNPINTPQVAYNLNTINLAALKTAVQVTPKMSIPEAMGNVVVNANGEVINIAQLVDFESLINQAQVSKATTKPKKRHRDVKDVTNDDNIIKIDLTDSDNQNTYDTGQDQLKYDKLPHIKSTQNDKFTYTIKVEDKPNVNPTVIFNPMTSYQQTPNTCGNYQTYTSTSVYPTSTMNLVTTSGTNSLVTSNICTVPSMEASTVNLNVLSNHSIPEVTYTQNYGRNTLQQQTLPQSSYTNVISSTASALQTMNNTINTNNHDNSDNNNSIVTTKYEINQNNMPVNNVNITSMNTVNLNVTAMSNSSVTNITTSNISVQGNNQKMHACEICQKHFKRKEHLYQHIKLHTGFRPYACENCNKSFMRKEHLLRHMTSHSGQKNFTCNICDKSFSRNDNLLKHKKTHDKQSSYSCEVCNKQFVMKHYYLAHKMAHDDDSCRNVCVLKA